VLKSRRLQHNPYPCLVLPTPSLHRIGTLTVGWELDINRLEKDPLLLLPVRFYPSMRLFSVTNKLGCVHLPQKTLAMCHMLMRCSCTELLQRSKRICFCSIVILSVQGIRPDWFEIGSRHRADRQRRWVGAFSSQARTDEAFYFILFVFIHFQGQFHWCTSGNDSPGPEPSLLRKMTAPQSK